MKEEIKRKCIVLLKVVVIVVICLLIVLVLKLAGVVKPAADQNEGSSSVPESLSLESVK